MDRPTFTIKIANLILWVVDQGWFPILDYALRSTEEQARLFKEGKSKCDGVNTLSNHQRGKAVDLYIHDGDNDIRKEEIYQKAHAKWEELGGKKMISWDLAHFEV